MAGNENEYRHVFKNGDELGASDLNKMQDWIEAAEGKADASQTDATDAKNKANTLEGNVTTLTSKVTAAENAVNSMSTTVAGHTTAIGNLQTSLAGKADSQEVASALNSKANTADVESALSGKANASDVAEIEDLINGIEDTSTVDIEVIEGYFNLGSAIEELGTRKTPTSEGTFSAKIPVQVGDIVEIRGTGDKYSLRMWATVDNNNNILERASGTINTRTNPLSITVALGVAYVVVNLRSYDNTTDSIKKTTSIHVEGLSDKVEKIAAGIWSGRKVAMFGDSIVENILGGKKTIAQHITDITGATCYNFGIGGTRIRQRSTPLAEPSQDQGYYALDVSSLISAITGNLAWSFVEAGAQAVDEYREKNYMTKVVTPLETVDWNKIDTIIISAGTNDWHNNPSIGSSGSTTISTTLGAINLINSMLATRFPHIRVFWFTPVVRWNEGGTDPNDYCDETHALVDGVSLPSFVSQMKAEVELSNNICCDMYHGMGWNRDNMHYFFTSGTTYDGTHPFNGYKEMAKKMVGFINSHMW